jgi:choloylglycine hydrolase
MVIKQFGQGLGLVGLPGDFPPPSRLARIAAFTQLALPVKGPKAGLIQVMTIINNVDIPLGHGAGPDWLHGHGN